MQRILHSVIVLAAATAISSCDKEVCPYQDERLCDREYRDSLAAVEPDTSLADAVLTYEPGAFSAIERNAYLEYFTGFRCNNCPPASSTARNIKADMGSRVVAVFVHASSTFAAPIAEPPANYSTDFRTNEGEQYLGSFQITGFPAGTVNRTNFGTGFAVPTAEWQSRIDSEINEPAVGFLDFTEVNHDTENNTVLVRLAYKVIEGNTSDYNLTVGIGENGIIEAQKDGPNDVYPYVHDYVFRGNVNGTWGEELQNPEPALGTNEAMRKSYRILLEDDWNPDELYFFAYLHRKEDRSIIQAADAFMVP
ncbi:MAG: Omp28-related outer membrane protein [Cryomorphaceae bacterium]|nr:Omp28-related outer membrane protein [Flavobacteriales bacterium]